MPGAGKTPVLDVRDLKKHFPIRKGLLRKTVGHVYAVDGVTFSIGEGETLGLVGESGCGKSTVGRAILRLIEPTSGQVLIDGQDIAPLSKKELRPMRQRMQIIFQDPFSSLNPRMTAGDIVGEPFIVHGIATGQDKRDRVAALFDRVGLRKAQMDNFPHQFSGGQRQRIGIAKALALNPRLIIGDEPVSALDVSIQAQVINLLMDLQKERSLSYLFISHNLAVVEHISPSHRGDVSGPDRRVRGEEGALQVAEAPLYGSAAVGRAGARSRHQAHPADRVGRRAEPRETATRLPFPHALPLCRAALQGRGAQAARGRAGPVRELPSALRARLRVPVAIQSIEWGREDA